MPRGSRLNLETIKEPSSSKLPRQLWASIGESLPSIAIEARLNHSSDPPHSQDDEFGIPFSIPPER